MSLDQYVEARNGLIAKDLIAFDGTLFQVLCLPAKAPAPRKRPVPSDLCKLIQKSIKGI